MDKCWEDYTAYNLPIVSMALLLKIKYYSEKGFLFIAPHCNVRYVSASRVTLMQEKISLIGGSSVTILLCEEVVDSFSDAIKGDCLLFKNEEDDNTKFVFKVQTKSLFPLYCLSLNDTPEIKDEKRFEEYYQNFQSTFDAGKSMTQIFCNIFANVAEKYQLTKNYEAGYNSMYEDMLKLPFLEMKQGTEEPQLPREASTTLKAVFYFQKICSLRMTILEGNHRHVAILLKALNLTINDTKKTIYKNVVEVPSNYKANFGLNEETNNIDLSYIQLMYAVHIASSKLSTRDIIEKAIVHSTLTNQQRRLAIDAEEIHWFVKLLDNFSEKLKERKELSEQYIGIIAKMLQENTILKTDVKKYIAKYNETLSKNLDDFNNVLCDALSIEKQEQRIRNRYYNTHAWKLFDNQVTTFYKTYNIRKDDMKRLYLFLFVDRCFDESTCHYISHLFINYYHHLHHDDCVKHNITPTLVLNNTVLGHAAQLNSLLIDASLKVLTKHESSFQKFLAPQFFFYVVIILLEDVGLYPIVEHLTWKISDEEKSLPPSKYNSLRFLTYIIEREDDAFLKLKENKFFIEQLNSYGKVGNPFPRSLTEFATTKFRLKIKRWFWIIVKMNDYYEKFFIYCLNTVAVEDASKAMLSTDEPTNKKAIDVTSKRKGERETLQTSNNGKKRVKSAKHYYNHTDNMMLSHLTKRDLDLLRLDIEPTENCQENMAQSMECPINCNNSGNCLNQPVKNLRQKNSIKEKPRFSVKLSESNEKGYGLFSNVQLEKNEAFLEYIGEVEKKKNNTSDVNRMYIADLTSSFEVNAANYGNEARFINHSCTPNAKMIKWTVDRMPTILIIAIRKIQQGDEITTDYNWTINSTNCKTTPCLCKAHNCRGTIEKIRKGHKKGGHTNTNVQDGEIHTSSTILLNLSKDTIDTQIQSVEEVTQPDLLYHNKPASKTQVSEPLTIDYELNTTLAIGINPTTKTINDEQLDNELQTLIYEKGMEERIELLTVVEDFLDLQQLLNTVQTLLKGRTKNKFTHLPNSNVYQFQKDSNDAEGVWGILATNNKSKRDDVNMLKNKCMKLFKTSQRLSSNIQWDELMITLLYTEGREDKKQDPHTDYELKKVQSPNELAWTAHLPLNKNEGSYLYIWSGTGCGTAVHIKGGQCLLLRSDVIHSGGLPRIADKDNSYIRLHFYLPTYSQKPPTNNTIERKGLDGCLYSHHHWHEAKPTRNIQSLGVGRINNSYH